MGLIDNMGEVITLGVAYKVTSNVLNKTMRTKKKRKCKKKR